MKNIEERLVIPTTEKKKIYCTLGHPARKTKSIVLLLHGLGCSELWPNILFGSWYFRKMGYAYCRVNLYDWRENARTLMTSDLLQHAKDCDVVVRRLKKSGYTKIFAVGHSFGGLSLLQARTSEFQALSFWDISSFISYPPQSWYRKDPEGGSTYLLGGYELMLSKRYRDGIDHFPNELGLISKIKVPTQICYANGPERFLVESSARYFEHLSSEKELVAVPAASHSFTEEGVGEFLFKRTHKWFKRWN